MRTLDETGKEITKPDLDKGYLVIETIILKHHDAVPFRPAVVEKEVYWEDANDPDNKLYRTVEKSPIQWPRAAWDETETIQRYVKYTEAELAERAEQKAAAEEAEREAERLAAEEAAKQAAREELLNTLPDALVEVADIAAANEESTAANKERLDILEDAIVEVAALIGGE